MFYHPAPSQIGCDHGQGFTTVLVTSPNILKGDAAQSTLVLGMVRGSAEKTQLLAKFVGEDLQFLFQESPFVVSLKDRSSLQSVSDKPEPQPKRISRPKERAAPPRKRSSAPTRVVIGSRTCRCRKAVHASNPLGAIECQQCKESFHPACVGVADVRCCNGWICPICADLSSVSVSAATAVHSTTVPHVSASAAADLTDCDPTNTMFSMSCSDCSRDLAESAPRTTPPSCAKKLAVSPVICCDWPAMQAICGLQPGTNIKHYCPQCYITTKMPRSHSCAERTYSTMMADLAKIDGNVLHRNQQYAPVVSLNTATMIAQAPLHGMIGLVNDADDALYAKMQELDKKAKTKREEGPRRQSNGEVDAPAAEMDTRYRRMQLVIDSLREFQNARTSVIDLEATIKKKPWKRVKVKLSNPVQSQEEQQLEKEKKSLQAEIDEAEGPFTRKYASVLKGVGIVREKYHGGALNGNNCHKLLKKREEIITELRVFKCSGGTAIDVGWLDTIKMLLGKLANIFTLATANRPLCRHEVVQLRQHCIDFGEWYPGKIAKDLSYKGHRIAQHLWKYAEHWGRRGQSPGMHSEQFAEAIHQVVKKAATAWRSRYNGTPQQLQGIFLHVQRMTRVDRECEKEHRK